MKTLDLHEAAAFLRLHPETLRRRAMAGEIPSAKPGKAWVFIDEDLAAWLRARYAQEARAAKPRGEPPCFTADPQAASGGSGSPDQTARRYASLLAPKTARTPRSTRRK